MGWLHSLVCTGRKNAHDSLKLLPPENIDLNKLATLTASSLKALQPWCNAEHQSEALMKITVQAHIYTEAIHFSIEAAQQGFNVANDALTLSQSINSREKSEEELQKYVQSMLLAGQDAHSKAQACLDRFRNVRKVLTELINGAKSSTEHPKEVIEGKLKPLEAGIPLFEDLVENVSIYVRWWNWLELKANSQVVITDQLRINYNSMRRKAVIERWGVLKNAFVRYTQDIQKLEDTHPDMFPPSIKSEELKDIPPSPRPTSLRRQPTTVLTSEYIQHRSENRRPKEIGRFRRFLRLISFKGCMPGSEMA